MLDAVLRVNSRTVRPGEFVREDLIKRIGLTKVGLVRRLLIGAGVGDTIWEGRDVILSLADDAVVYRPGIAATTSASGCTTTVRLSADRQDQIERVWVKVGGIASLRQSGVRKVFEWCESKFGRAVSGTAGTYAGTWSDTESVVSLSLENDDNDLVLEWYLVEIAVPGGSDA